jgi:hypothetical protein
VFKSAVSPKVQCETSAAKFDVAGGAVVLVMDEDFSCISRSVAVSPILLRLVSGPENYPDSVLPMLLLHEKFPDSC